MTEQLLPTEQPNPTEQPAPTAPACPTDAANPPSVHLLPPRTWLHREKLPASKVQLWKVTKACLCENDLPSAERALAALSASGSGVCGYTMRGRSVRAMLTLGRTWESRGALSARASRIVGMAAMMGCCEAVAFMAVLGARGRLSGSNLAEEGMLFGRLELAAERGHAAAKAVLGLRMVGMGGFEGGRFGGGREVGRGVGLLKEAAGEGCFLAVEWMEGVVVEGLVRGKGGLVGAEEYFEAVLKAAEEGDAECAVRVAKLLRKGVGCRKSETEAREWIRVAARRNVPGAVSAAHAEAVRENLEIGEIVAGGGGERGRFKEIRMRGRENGQFVRECEERMRLWRGDVKRKKVLLMLHRLCGLNAEVPSNLSEALLRFIFQRDRHGWVCRDQN